MYSRGAFALLLSLALASLIPVWVHRKDEMVLGRYLGLRLNLTAALDALDEDPLWQEYKQKHDTNQETTTFRGLKQVPCGPTKVKVSY
jgi:hypothetical protein